MLSLSVKQITGSNMTQVTSKHRAPLHYSSDFQDDCVLMLTPFNSYMCPRNTGKKSVMSGFCVSSWQQLNVVEPVSLT